MDKKTKILVVDDEPINLEFFDVMLGKLGFGVELARDGEEALDKVKQSSPDLIILNSVMPKLSGWKVTRLLKTDEEYAQYREIPIIMFSEFDDVKDKIEGYEIGIEDFIVKPFNFSEVLARIRAVLRSSELSRRVAKRERRIVLVETLNRSLVYVTRQLKAPVSELLESAKSLDRKNPKAIEQFISRVTEELEESLSALNGLEKQIAELEKETELLQLSDIDLQDLEERFQKHLAQSKSGQDTLKEVRQ
ncbi:MAG TPA: response regulator [Spirochaetia bacterium]|nr:response regulator [Spirochaetia bacterium]